MSIFNELLLAFSGLIAGLIDSIAGGGGLITLPVLTSIVGPGAHAVGTNKIVGTLGALIAFLVYLRKQKFNLKKSILFVIAVGVGSALGSLVTPILPVVYFRYLLVVACPLILILIWNKNIFIQEVKDHAARSKWVLMLAGLLVGFYDGFFGPGGGTFMLLGLLWGVKLPLFEALLLSKFANTVSAGTALVSYGVQGFVHAKEGLIMALGMVLGCYVGARFASSRAERLVRPVLAFVVLLLLVRQIQELTGLMSGLS